MSSSICKVLPRCGAMPRDPAWNSDTGGRQIAKQRSRLGAPASGLRRWHGTGHHRSASHSLRANGLLQEVGLLSSDERGARPGHIAPSTGIASCSWSGKERVGGPVNDEAIREVIPINFVADYPCGPSSNASKHLQTKTQNLEPPSLQASSEVPGTQHRPCGLASCAAKAGPSAPRPKERGGLLTAALLSSSTLAALA